MGKSSLVVQFCAAIFQEDAEPNPGTYRKMFMVDYKSVILELAEADCNEEIVFLSQLAREGDGFMIVYDISRRDSYKSVSRFLQLLYDIHKQEVPVLIFANKSDLEEEKRKVLSEEAEEYAREHKALFVEGSSKTAEGIDEGFSALVRKIRQLGIRDINHNKNPKSEPPPPPPIIREVDEGEQGRTVKRARG